ncbi:spinster family MFS transporter [Elongatibacter sediminis]|uniref:MFS transporter n=1 Tax=Elongatibacter sediminis TaxID=3119006 RepID=A0AAW9R8Q0_9GAMM
MKAERSSGENSRVGGRYARYVLVVLFLVYVCNFVDRLIISILAEDLKAQLGVSDRQLGFIAGTAFAVFYALFGLPLGRLADIWVRKRLIAIGLFVWSGLTMLSGTAASFLQLAVYRCGIGIGEASASPAAFSMLSDYFAQRSRATVLAIYSSGAYVGMGLGILAGGWILDTWKQAYPDVTLAPFGLSAWQAAFLIVGAPGLLLGLLVSTLKEPVRGQTENILTEDHPQPVRETLKELMAIVPPFSIVNLIRRHAGWHMLAWNAGVALFIVGMIVALSHATDSPGQWIVFGFGLYATFSWVQNLSIRDAPAYAMMFRCRGFMYTIFGFCSINFVTYGLAVWIPSFFIRVHGMDVGEVGTIVGLSVVIAGGISINVGGILADRWKARTPNGRLYLGLITILLTVPAALTLFTTTHVKLALVMNFMVAGLTAMWVGPATSTIMDLVLPRMRAVTAAFYFLLNVFLGLAIGPFMIGLLSDVLAGQGYTQAESLRMSMTASVFTLIIPLVLIYRALSHLARDEASRLSRARLAGEPDV